MSDRRCKNTNWNLNPNGDGTVPNSDARLAVLMDIRDELQTLNAVFRCHNFLALPHDIKRMRLALERKHRKRKA